MSSHLGDDTTPPAGNGPWTDSFTNVQFWNTASYTMPAGGGVVTDFYVYMAAQSGTVTIKGVIWDGSGNILWSSGSVAKGTTLGWVHIAVPNLFVAAGGVHLGFWTSGHVLWKFENSGGVQRKSGVSSPGSATGGVDEYGGQGFGNLGVYIVYQPGGGQVYHSGAWTACQPQIYHLGSWTPLQIEVYHSGSWVPVQ